MIEIEVVIRRPKSPCKMMLMQNSARKDFLLCTLGTSKSSYACPVSSHDTWVPGYTAEPEYPCQGTSEGACWAVKPRSNRTGSAAKRIRFWSYPKTTPKPFLDHGAAQPLPTISCLFGRRYCSLVFHVGAVSVTYPFLKMFKPHSIPTFFSLHRKTTDKSPYITLGRTPVVV